MGKSYELNSQKHNSTIDSSTNDSVKLQKYGLTNGGFEPELPKTSPYSKSDAIKKNQVEPITNGTLAKEHIANDGHQKTYVIGVKGDPFRCYRFTKQTILVLVWVCIGMYAEIVGPTLNDLMYLIGANYEEISRSLVGKSIGLMAGAIVGGFLHERFYKQTDLLIAIGLVLASAATVITPLSRTIAMAAAAFALNGFAEGIINTGGNTMVMHIWGDKATAPMHSLHFGFGFGAILAPQIARPFLRPDTNNETSTSTPYGTEAPEQESRILIPYIIIAVLIFLFSIVILGFFIKGPPKGYPKREQTTNIKRMLSPGSCAGGKIFLGLQMFIVLFVYFIQAVGGERIMSKFLVSFARDSDVNMSPGRAATLQSAFWFSFTAGRLLGVPLGALLPIPVFIFGDAILNLIAAIIMAIFAYNNETMLWVFTCLMGLGIAVAFPNGMSWANLYMNVNSMAVMILMIGGACGGFIYQYLTGYLFENDGPRSMLYVLVGYAVVLNIIVIVMQIMAKIQGPKIARAVAEEEGTVLKIDDKDVPVSNKDV